MSLYLRAASLPKPAPKYILSLCVASYKLHVTRPIMHERIANRRDHGFIKRERECLALLPLVLSSAFLQNNRIKFSNLTLKLVEPT